MKSGTMKLYELVIRMKALGAFTLFFELTKISKKA